MIAETDDTIVGIATAPGKSALGIVRLSGKKTRQIIASMFVPARETAIVPFRAHFGRLTAGGSLIDEAIVVFYESPHSYTREDLAEISCHGNPAVQRRIVERAVELGARLAGPGEFTYRAFLNGRLDLVQAEAVQELVAADSIAQVELALGQLEGRLSAKIGELRTKFLELTALLEANVDLSEEQHYSFIEGGDALRRMDELEQGLGGLIGTFERGRLIREGMGVAIVGKPNAGKSCIFNKLLGSDRAIVTPIPGTTRDYLCERLTVGGYVVRLMDTAGIRESEEEIEKEGIRRSRQVVADANVVIFVLDGTTGWTAEDSDLWEELRDKHVLAICNKADLPEYRIVAVRDVRVLKLSSVSGEGIDELWKELEGGLREAVGSGSEASQSLVSNVRHLEALERARESLRRAKTGMAGGVSEEYALQDLHDGLRALGEITGEVMVEDLYDFIFSKFCIGK